MKESDIQQACIEYLSHLNKKLFYFAPLNETAMMILQIFKVPKIATFKIMAFLKKMGMVAGVPDIQIIYGGKAYFIELKTPTGNIKEHQKQVHEQIAYCGAGIYIARSVEEFIEIVEEITG